MTPKLFMVFVSVWGVKEMGNRAYLKFGEVGWQKSNGDVRGKFRMGKF